MAENSLSRRALLQRAALGATGMTIGGWAQQAGALVRKDALYGPYQMGMQSYTLRNFSVDVAIEKISKFGMHFMEGFPGHVPQTDDPAKIKEMLAKLKSHDVKMLGWGVVGFNKDQAAARKVFDFAKAMGITALSADPEKESFDYLDKLVAEYKINIAIHNHGPGARYDKIKSMEDAIKDHHPRIGICLDTGHLLRSGESPTQALKVFGSRVYGIHIKDVKDKTKFVEVGQGDLDPVGFFRQLKSMKYRHMMVLEYEENPSNPFADIDRCLFAVKDAIGKS